MKTHISVVLFISIGLFFLIPTLGCRLNGGPFYSPASWHFYNPFRAQKATDSKERNIADASVPAMRFGTSPDGLAGIHHVDQPRVDYPYPVQDGQAAPKPPVIDYSSRIATQKTSSIQR